MKTNLWNSLVLGAALMAMTACNNARVPAPADLQRKLDSVMALEQVERLRAQGINVGEEVSPMVAFYDSLAIQPLPLRFSADYVAELPNYQTVPLPIVQQMNFEGRVSTKAIALPETSTLRLMIVAGDDGDNRVTLWLYSLGADCFPVDRLCLYSPDRQLRLGSESLTTEFTITSDYEVYLTTYTTDHKTERQRVFTVDALLHFEEWNTGE